MSNGWRNPGRTGALLYSLLAAVAGVVVTMFSRLALARQRGRRRAAQRLPDGPKVTATQNWHDIPTCVESGLAIPQFQQPRTVWLPGKVTPDQAAFYVDLMKKVQATPEWKEYIERTSQTDTFLTGDAFSKFIKEDIERTRKVAVDEGWLISN